MPRKRRVVAIVIAIASAVKFDCAAAGADRPVASAMAPAAKMKRMLMSSPELTAMVSGQSMKLSVGFVTGVVKLKLM